MAAVLHKRWAVGGCHACSGGKWLEKMSERADGQACRRSRLSCHRYIHRRGLLQYVHKVPTILPAYSSRTVSSPRSPVLCGSVGLVRS